MATATKKETFKVGDHARVSIDWENKKVPVKTAMVKVVSLQQNGKQTFAKVKWLGTNAVMLSEQYGNLFTFDELRKA